MDLDAPFLTAPLKSLLSRPDKDILRRLSILETRYKRYRAGAEMAQGQEFYTDTKLFTLLSEESVVAVARKITRDTLMNFLKISYDGILTSDCHLKGLATEWNCFFFESEELSAFGGLNSSLSALAKELYYLRNFFSLSALLSGMCQAGIELEHEFAEFIDSGSNHRRYRLKFHMEPSLPFLYPFIRDLKRGKFTAVNGIFSFLLYGQFLERLIG
ncbi:hypothetical protein N7523_010250 [Penicillium sp. IBT 18751x]|nr:hypothetical protein N7523_010250 [Penicillium sp. IBT 18751x]